MIASMIPIISIILALVCASPAIGRDRNELITKLFPKNLLGEYGRYQYGKTIDKGYVEGPVYRSEMKLALLGKNKIGEEMVTSFMEKGSTQPNIKALFVTTDDMAKVFIEKLIRRHASLEDLSAVIVQTDRNVRSIIEQLVEDKDESKDIKALMFVKDQAGKDLIDQVFTSEIDRLAFKVFLVGNEDKTQGVLKQFLTSHSANKEIKLAFFEKENHTSTIVSSLFNTESDDMKAILTGPESQIKEMIFRLVDRHDVTNDLNIVVMGNETRTSEMVTMFSKIRPEQEEIKLILLDKFGNEKVASSGFVSSEVKPAEVNDDLSNEGKKAIYINNGLIEETRYQIRCSGVADELEVVRSKLQTFFIRLKLFFYKANFNYEAFEAVGPQLDEQLEGLNSAVSRVEFCEKRFLIELAFLNRMYAYMVEAIELLRYYQGSDAPGRRLLFSVVESNVQLFALRNVEGDPDPTIDGYALKVRHYLQLLNSWAAELKLLGEVPFGLKMMFRKQFSLAEAALVPLASAIVKHEIDFS